MRPRSIVALVLLSLVSGSAVAGATPLPEPGILELLAISGVVGIAVAIRGRRK